MGWDSDNRRWRGYEVIAYCDAKGCEVEIDRGFGYVCECPKCHDSEPYEITTYVCGQHTCSDVDPDNMPEHPRWIEHVSTDESWAQWRDENPVLAAAMQATP